MTTSSPARNGFFRSMIDAVVSARQRRAERYVAATLMAFDADTLRAHGYDPEEVARRPRGAPMI